MATLNIWDRFSLIVSGQEITARHGTDPDLGASVPFSITVDGKAFYTPNQIATAAVAKLWDEDENLPTDFDFAFFVADQDCYIQLVGQTKNYVRKVLAGVPYVFTFDTFQAAAATTDILGNTEPTLEKIDHINVGNYSGSTANYVFFLVD